MKALLKIAGQVQMGGNFVTEADLEQARKQGASDREIHDPILIAAAFCMYNRYADGLASIAPEDPSVYKQMACQIVESGYPQEF
ncbi:MAG: hypothetical protein GDA43_07505 [Hormoscilla sp. SP5CHS1]|nr:hypothetical protein [Hormoscilla sp. SP5CHS1]